MPPKPTASVELRPGRGDAKARVEKYWHVYADGHRAGRVFIKLADEPPFGRHHSIQIFLNQAARGRGIGSIAYGLACQASGYREIYAHMRKSNLASRRAAEKAGFGPVDSPGGRQLSLVWRAAD